MFIHLSLGIGEGFPGGKTFSTKHFISEFWLYKSKATFASFVNSFKRGIENNEKGLYGVWRFYFFHWVWIPPCTIFLVKYLPF